MVTNEQIKELHGRVETLHTCLDIEGKRKEVAERTQQSLAPDFWNDPSAA